MKITTSRGFTLVEITVVLLIMGLLLGALMQPLSTSIEQGQRKTLAEDYDDIEDALLGFVIINGRFPCPDCSDTDTAEACRNKPNRPDDGIEDISGTGCAVGATDVIEGNLPWTTLGVTGQDPWGRTLQYAVDEDFADTDVGSDINIPGCTSSPDSMMSFSLCSQAVMTIKDKGDECLDAIPTDIAQGIPVVVYSEGKHEATSCNELDNKDNGNKVFVYMEYNASDDQYYDDMLLWISPYVLKSRLVSAEILP